MKRPVLNMSGVFTEPLAPNFDIVYVGKNVVGSIVCDESNAPAVWHAYVSDDSDDGASLVGARTTFDDALRFVLAYS